MYSVVDRLNWAAKQVKSIDNTHPVITHVGYASVIQDVVGDSSDDKANAKAVDFYGSSLPVSQMSSGDTKQTAEMGMINDWIRSVSKYYWISKDINTKIKSSKVTAKLEVDKAEMLGLWEEDNTPAITVNRYGKGKAIYIGTYPSISFFTFPSSSHLFSQTELLMQ